MAVGDVLVWEPFKWGERSSQIVVFFDKKIFSASTTYIEAAFKL